MEKYTRYLIVIVTALVVKYGLNYWNPLNLEINSQKSEIKVFTKDIFKQQSADNKIYLGFLGNVYDVTKGAKYYGKDGSYEFFAGKDATRAFATGNFKDDLNDNIEDFTEHQVGELFNWKKTYDDGYIYLGKLEGAFYDSNGQKTQILIDAEDKLTIHKHNENKNEKFKNRFPPCNSQWIGDTNTNTIWCTNKSGGVNRKWTGYPRKVFNSYHNSNICGCVNEPDLDHPSVSLYENCDPKSTRCEIKKTD